MTASNSDVTPPSSFDRLRMRKFATPLMLSLSKHEFAEA
jgi:hypothetical protein